jgi:hypothetical protein
MLNHQQAVKLVEKAVDWYINSDIKNNEIPLYKQSNRDPRYTEEIWAKLMVDAISAFSQGLDSEIEPDNNRVAQKDNEERAKKYKKLLEDLGFEFNDVGGWPDSLSFYRGGLSDREPYSFEKSVDGKSANVQIDFIENKLYLNDYSQPLDNLKYHRAFDITNDNIPIDEIKAVAESIEIIPDEEVREKENKSYQKLKEEGKCTKCWGTGYSGPYGNTCSSCEGSGWAEEENDEDLDDYYTDFQASRLYENAIDVVGSDAFEIIAMLVAKTGSILKSAITCPQCGGYGGASILEGGTTSSDPADICEVCEGVGFVEEEELDETPATAIPSIKDIKALEAELGI